MPGAASARVSVIVPVYNRETLIAATVESVWAQSYPNLELVAVDDASTDGTYAVLESLQRRSPIPMRVARRATNGGMNPTLNSALALSSGELIAILDSDDRLTPGRFETQVSRLSDDSELMIVYGNGRQLLPDGSIGERVHSPETLALLSRPPAEILERLYVGINPIFIQTILIRRSFLEAIGGFDEEVLSNDGCSTSGRSAG
jgi:glycosyltransferase involved in cell wall biosynthesis